MSLFRFVIIALIGHSAIFVGIVQAHSAATGAAKERIGREKPIARDTSGSELWVNRECFIQSTAHMRGSARHCEIRELQLGEVAVERAIVKQFGMPALGNQTALLQNQNTVGL